VSPAPRGAVGAHHPSGVRPPGRHRGFESTVAHQPADPASRNPGQVFRTVRVALRVDTSVQCNSRARWGPQPGRGILCTRFAEQRSTRFVVALSIALAVVLILPMSALAAQYLSIATPRRTTTGAGTCSIPANQSSPSRSSPSTEPSTQRSFYLSKRGAPTGDVFAALYACTGTHGVDAMLRELRWPRRISCGLGSSQTGAG